MPIRGVGKVVVGVEDQARAKEFWSAVVGFAVTTDVPYDDQGRRWVEVTAPDGTILVLSENPEDRPRATAGQLPTSNFFLYADDIEKTYEELSAKGVEFPAKPEKQPWGWWSMFTDSEGNRFALQQR
ncbi:MULTISPECIES: VOC family protein [unclassified Amycolatopsis]|uniref:VOC family protein n=1 Tax=unclassified Amycolatopsis TaxID=2618356 RepID=UPI00287611EC|nr:MULTISPECIES: VOC family protein [unclassified Amycolatopsis]MDS0137308.1 VOC family protein [Amycolatopsis sp. 505]MDS0141503.1 VOC family protein [Amycolatopsis sp. CM201R]